MTKLFFNIKLYNYIHVLTLCCAYHVDLVNIFCNASVNDSPVRLLVITEAPNFGSCHLRNLISRPMKRLFIYRRAGKYSLLVDLSGTQGIITDV
jgi:hypothetical protein